MVSEADLLPKEEYSEGDLGRYGQSRPPPDLDPDLPNPRGSASG
ncbi:hypothetical protein ACIP4Y_14290 [Streptomyces sp. NPDC088810]